MTKDRKMKEFVASGSCECGGKMGAWVVHGPKFSKWLCLSCKKETAVYWDD